MKVVYLPASGKGRDPSARERGRERENERGRDGPFIGPSQQGALLSCSEKRHEKVLNLNQAPELFYRCRGTEESGQKGEEMMGGQKKLGGLEGRGGDEKRSEESRREEENGKGQGRGDKWNTV